MKLSDIAPHVGFGTSGVRALVSDLTHEAVEAFVSAFIKHLRNTRQLNSDICVVGWDLRPSSPQIAAWVASALVNEGLTVEWAGCVPTPALALRSMALAAPGVMVSGSHIPFDRNGIKFYTARGEILKADELGIAQIDLNDSMGCVSSRSQYAVDDKMLEAVIHAAQSKSIAYIEYVDRYLKLLPKNALADIKIGLYQHSAVGRDLLAALLSSLGAIVIPLGRSENFVPIDTEAVSKEDEERARAWCQEHELDAVVSTDGDGDRPWICDENGRFLRGDLVGILTALWLGAQAVVTPVSSNSALEKSNRFTRTLRTRIGSPFVIEGMHALASERNHKVVGFEANGGFLVQDELRGLSSLPTRDSVLPILAVLASAKAKGIALSHLTDDLPKRFTQADRIKDLPTARSQALIGVLTKDPLKLEGFLKFTNSKVRSLDVTDGLRVELVSGDIVHLRPSGNAPELRCYVESSSENKALDLLGLSLKNFHTVVDKL